MREIFLLKNYREAFSAVKNAIVDLLNAANEDDMDSIRENMLAPTIKGRPPHSIWIVLDKTAKSALDLPLKLKKIEDSFLIIFMWLEFPCAA